MAYRRSESALPYLYEEKERRDKGLRDILNMFMMQKQLGEERGEKEFERGIEEEERERKFEHWGVQEELMKAQTEKALQPPVSKEPTIPAEIQAAIVISGQGGKPREEIDWGLVAPILQSHYKRKGPKPSAYTLRKRDIDKAVKLGTITQEQGNQALFNLKQELTPEEKRRKGASIRDSNARELRDFYKAIPELIKKGQIKSEELRKIVEKQGGGVPTSQQGYRLDMPERYNRAILNQKDGVATIEDTDTIKNYEDMFKIFIDELKDYPTFKSWIGGSPTNKLAGLDKNQMKIWYDIYGQKESLLEKLF